MRLAMTYMTLTTYIFLLSGWSIFVLVTLLWLVSLLIKNASIVDVFWGIGFVFIAWLDYSISPFMSSTKWLLLILVTIWGLRLALHILIRNWGKPEDFRYAKWREEHGKRWPLISYFQVFLLQGLLMWIIATPLISVRVTDGIPQLSPLAVLGALLWAYGFFFEAVGDWQLARFKADPANKGKLMAIGVWKYTRHPNYFGDAAQWWGFYLIAASAGGWWTVFSPIIMTWLLINVSGVAMLERAMKDKPGYKEYAKKTSAFIPWRPKP
jgi:steroid 5-alpha reductase family enzyme